MIKTRVITWLISLCLMSVTPTISYAAPIDDLVLGYSAGTFMANDTGYASLYSQTTDRSLTLYSVTEQEGRTAAIYTLSYNHEGGYYSESGVLVLHHHPVRLEFLEIEGITPTTIDLAIAGQAADIVSTALAISSGLMEGNPVVSAAIGTPAGAAAIVALKLAVPSLANNLELKNCVKTRTAFSAIGWGATAFNISLATGGVAAVGIGLGMLAGWFAADATEKDAPLRCAGIKLQE